MGKSLTTLNVTSPAAPLCPRSRQAITITLPPPYSGLAIFFYCNNMSFKQAFLMNRIEHNISCRLSDMLIYLLHQVKVPVSLLNQKVGNFMVFTHHVHTYLIFTFYLLSYFKRKGIDLYMDLQSHTIMI